MSRQDEPRHHVVVVRVGRTVEMSCVCGWLLRAPVPRRGHVPTQREAFDLHVRAVATAAAR